MQWQQRKQRPFHIIFIIFFKKNLIFQKLQILVQQKFLNYYKLIFAPYDRWALQSQFSLFIAKIS